MNILLDTHTFIWWIMNDPRLSHQGRTLLKDTNHRIFFSVASSCEIAIKVSLNKLELLAVPTLHEFVMEQLRVNMFEVLPISLHHSLHTATLPPLHRDPFDRMLVAQSQLEQIPILTKDPLITRYDVETIW